MIRIVTRGLGDPQEIVKRGYDGNGYIPGPYHEVLDLDSPEPVSLSVLNVVSKPRQSFLTTQRFTQSLQLVSRMDVEDTS
jgi:hypothetical protein